MSEATPAHRNPDQPAAATLAPHSSPISGRSWAVAVGYGALAGTVAGLTFWLMNGVQHLLWSRADSALHTAGVIMVGGLLIAGLRSQTEEAGVDAQLAQASNPIELKRRRTLFLALSAIIAVGFGGAVGPEAGLIAVVSELSAIIAIKLARSREEERLIGETGAVAALSGLYAAPPGAALLNEEQSKDTPLALKIAGGVAGLGGFLLIFNGLAGGGSGVLPLPEFTGVHSGSEILYALLPAALGAVVGAIFVKLTPLLGRALHTVGQPAVQTLVGTSIFALLAACFPLLRFSGHQELMHALEHGVHGEAGRLLALGLEVFGCALGLLRRGSQVAPVRLLQGHLAGVFTVQDGGEMLAQLFLHCRPRHTFYKGLDR